MLNVNKNNQKECVDVSWRRTLVHAHTHTHTHTHASRAHLLFDGVQDDWNELVVNSFRFTFCKVLKDKVHDAVLGFRPHAEPEARKFARAECVSNGLQPVVAAARAASLKGHLPECAVDVVVEHQDVGRGHAVRRRELGNRPGTKVRLERKANEEEREEKQSRRTVR